MNQGARDVLTGFAIGEALLYAASLHAHKEMSHQSVSLHPLVRELSRFALLFGSGIDSRQYAAVHIKHHATADTPDDPHSPQHQGKLKVLFGTGYLNTKARRSIQDILDQRNLFKHRASDEDPAFTRQEDGSIELKSHPADTLLRHGAVAYGLGLGACMKALGVKRGSTIFATASATFLGVTGAINAFGHTEGVKLHKDTPGTNLPEWTTWISAGEAPGHNNHHFDPSNPRIAPEDVIDPGYEVALFLEKLGLAEIAAED